MNGSEMLIRRLSHFPVQRGRGSAARDRELSNVLITTIRLHSRSGRAVVCFLAKSEVAFDSVEDVDDGIARMRRHPGKSFLANGSIDGEDLRYHRPSGGCQPQGPHAPIRRMRPALDQTLFMKLVEHPNEGDRLDTEPSSDLGLADAFISGDVKDDCGLLACNRQ